MEFKDYLLMPIKTKVANFADKAEKAIAANYNESFGIGNQKIKVYSASNSDNSCVAMLTISGVWMWHDEWWGGRNYEVKCTAEDIFNQFVELIECDDPDNTMECALFHFLFWCETLPGMKEETGELEDYLRTTTLQKNFPMKKYFNK
jgi:hypothetical protein